MNILDFMPYLIPLITLIYLVRGVKKRDLEKISTETKEIIYKFKHCKLQLDYVISHCLSEEHKVKLKEFLELKEAQHLD